MKLISWLIGHAQGLPAAWCSPGRARACLGVAMLGLYPAQQAAAKPPSVKVLANADLRFGAFGVMATGARTISTAGAVTNFGIIPVPGSPTGPAEFSVVYDRG